MTGKQITGATPSILKGQNSGPCVFCGAALGAHFRATRVPLFASHARREPRSVPKGSESPGVRNTLPFCLSFSCLHRASIRREIFRCSLESVGLPRCLGGGTVGFL